ncbi:hypothetical protein PISL3812_08424 [Talaromyces islandicus]|uniref:Uncharacterized protein n=1 Tax=Talaromyces islandicus TaxID=28573 RepID=A0A0U1M8Y5_TALIS|nr:hypothetical protein PISL3812_08424 [Talaromyces islandicus]
MDNEMFLDESIAMAQAVDRILEGVNSLLDLTSDHIEQLKRVSDGPMIIYKFETSPEEFDYWMSGAGKGIKDIGLDENYEHFVIRLRYAWAIEGLRNFVLSEESLKFKRALSTITTLSFYLTPRTKSSSLDNGIDAPQQEFDRILSEYYSISAPAVAIELALSSSPNLLRQSSREVLKGFKYVNKIIIMLNIFPQSSQKSSPEDNFDLTDEEIQEMDENELCARAHKWYHERGIYLSEEFDLTVHYWNGENYERDSTHIRFRHNEWILTTSTPNLKFSLKRHLPNGELESIQVEYPLRELVNALQQRWTMVEYSRITEFVAEKQGRRGRASPDY